MRVVCLVPSMTETLLECGVNVVGRTRYCVHPTSQIQTITVVGGTKDLNSVKLELLQPDLLILDKEENNKDMSENSLCEIFVSHVTSLNSLSDCLRRLAIILNNTKLMELHFRCEKIILTPSKVWDWKKLPGQRWSWGLADLSNAGQTHNSEQSLRLSLRYMIWKNPWMSISPDTYIGDVITKLGGGDFLTPSSDHYPLLSDSEMSRSDTICLFSSEPYPFDKFKADLEAWAPRGAVVDGECYSWFGIRSLSFLERELGFQDSSL